MSRYILKYCAPVFLHRFTLNGTVTPSPGVIKEINKSIDENSKFHRDLTVYNYGQLSFDVRHIYPYGLSNGTYGTYIDFFVLTSTTFDGSELSMGNIGQFITRQLSGDWGNRGFDFTVKNNVYRAYYSSLEPIRLELCERITDDAYLKMESDFERSIGYVDSYYKMTDPMNYVRNYRYELEDALKTLKDLERTLVG